MRRKKVVKAHLQQLPAAALASRKKTKKPESSNDELDEPKRKKVKETAVEDKEEEEKEGKPKWKRRKSKSVVSLYMYLFSVLLFDVSHLRLISSGLPCRGLLLHMDCLKPSPFKYQS